MSDGVDSVERGLTVESISPRKGNQPGDGGDRDKAGKFKGRKAPTPLQRAFVAELKDGLTVIDAAKAVGASSGHALMRSRSVRALVHAGRRKRLDKIGALAVHYLGEAVAGKVNLSPTRWAAMQFAMKAAGLDLPEGEKDSEINDLRNMSLAQLESLASRIDKAKHVTIVPELPADAVQVIEKTSKDTV